MARAGRTRGGRRCNVGMNNSRLPPPPLPGAFGLPLGFAAGIVATLVAVATGATEHPARSVVLLAITVAAIAALTSPAAAFGTAALCWCLDDGFVLGRAGGLVATPRGEVAAVVLVATALTAVVSATAVRVLRQRLVRIDPMTAPIPAPRTETAPIARR